MERQISISQRTSIAAPPAMVCKCPLCKREVSPDMPGFLACTCGWGGPDDPLEAARGLSCTFMPLDRRIANAIARHDLRVISQRKAPPAPTVPTTHSSSCSPAR